MTPFRRGVLHTPARSRFLLSRTACHASHVRRGVLPTVPGSWQSRHVIHMGKGVCNTPARSQPLVGTARHTVRRGVLHTPAHACTACRALKILPPLRWASIGRTVMQWHGGRPSGRMQYAPTQAGWLCCPDQTPAKPHGRMPYAPTHGVVVPTDLRIGLRGRLAYDADRTHSACLTDSSPSVVGAYGIRPPIMSVGAYGIRPSMHVRPALRLRSRCPSIGQDALQRCERQACGRMQYAPTHLGATYSTEQFAESARLEDQIRANLRGLGYGR